MSRQAPSDYAADTAVRSGDRPGHYVADLSGCWDFRYPSGGVVMACALRAAEAELADGTLKPVSATAVFASPVPSGPLSIAVEVLRRGRSAAQVRAVLSPLGRGVGLELLAVFSRDGEGPDLTGDPAPHVPEPADAPPMDEPHPRNPHTRFPFFENFDIRLALGDRWWLPELEARPPRHGRWWRYRKPPRTAAGLLDPLALPPVVDSMPASILQALGPGAPRFRAPSLDLTVHWLEETDSEWLLAISYARRARAGYASAEIEIYDEGRRLIAFGTQTMQLRASRDRERT